MVIPPDGPNHRGDCGGRRPRGLCHPFEIAHQRGSILAGHRLIPAYHEVLGPLGLYLLGPMWPWCVIPAKDQYSAPRPLKQDHRGREVRRGRRGPTSIPGV